MIQKYDEELRQLIHPWKSKISKIVSLNCLRQIDEKKWACDPIVGYNKTTHILTRQMMGDYDCSCQGYTKRQDCSHRQALMIVFKANKIAMEPSLF